MFKVSIYTGRTSFNEKISQAIKFNLESFDSELGEEALGADVVVCLPEYIKLFPKANILVLSDDMDIVVENDNIIDLTPIPVSEDDYSRLEWKLIRILDSMTDGI